MSAFSAASDLSFPRPELTKIQGKPNYLSLETLKAELYDNASSIFSIRGNGQLGHAVLVLPSLGIQPLSMRRSPPPRI
jgi:hypothetical protein